MEDLKMSTNFPVSLTYCYIEFYDVKFVWTWHCFLSSTCKDRTVLTDIPTNLPKDLVNSQMSEVVIVSLFNIKLKAKSLYLFERKTCMVFCSSLFILFTPIAPPWQMNEQVQVPFQFSQFCSPAYFSICKYSSWRWNWFWHLSWPRFMYCIRSRFIKINYSKFMRWYLKFFIVSVKVVEWVISGLYFNIIKSIECYVMETIEILSYD